MHAVYDELPDVLDDLGLDAVDAVLFDLGVSSMQLDVRERGFAYAEDAPLDMRMDGTTGPTAADVLNTYSVDELARVLREYGEERFARKIAAAVVRQREAAPFTTSARLVELLYAEIPAPGPPHRRPPRQAHLPGAAHGGQRRARGAAPRDPGRHRRDPGRRPGGRRVLPLPRGPAGQAGLHRRDPVRWPRRTCRSCPRSCQPAFRLVTRGAERADADEIATNPRAASVRLRAVERIKATTGAREP